MDVTLLGNAAYHRKIPAGQQVAGAGEMYIVVSGGVEKISLANRKISGTLGPGEAFGAKWLFAGAAGGGTLFRATRDTTLFVLGEANFADVARTDPLVLYEILRAAVAPETAASTPPAAKPPADPPATAAQAPSTVTAAQGSLFPEGHAGYPGVVKPAYRAYTYLKEYKCPGCMKAFKTPKIFESKVKMAKPMRYDLREYHVDFQMEWYDVIVCPHCYFTALATLFEGSRNFLRVRLKDVMPDVTGVVRLDFAAERDLDFVFAAHYLALRCSPAYVNQRQINAKLWSDISWLYEDAQDENMARFAAAKAVEAYQGYYMEKNMTPTQEMMLSLATAGMLYRAGDLKDIRKWLFQVKTSKVVNKVYTNLADDLIDLAKVET